MLNKNIPFADSFITLSKASSPQGMDIKPLLKNPEAFFGDFHVAYIVDFGNRFIPLIGNYNEDTFGPWNEEKIKQEKVFVYEYYFEEARKILTDIRKLADNVMITPKLYDDLSFCKEYFALVKKGYAFMNNNRQTFATKEISATPISLERAGLVCIRAAKQLSQNAYVPQEVRVVAKRIHLKKYPDNFLAVTITWRDKNQLEKLVKNQAIEIIDTVIASGASSSAVILCAHAENAKPKEVIHTSINATKQGIRFLQKSFHGLGIQTTFHTLGIADELNSSYYLIGKRAVGDAGHILRHFLPEI